MFIADVISKGKNGKSYTSILLRESYRVGSSVKSRTLAILTHLPAHVLDAVRRAISEPAGSLDQLAKGSDGSLRLRQAESFGALWVVDQIAQQLGIKKALGVTDQAQLSYWQVIARVLRPGTSLLAMVRLAATGAAAALLGWRQAFTEDDLYANGAWLEGRHAIIECRLWETRAATQPKDQLFLYDLTSSFMEGQHNALADWGYNLEAHPRAKAQTQHRRLVARLQKLQVQEWLQVNVSQRHLEVRPWFVCLEENTRAHALTAMLGLKVRRHLEKA